MKKTIIILCFIAVTFIGSMFIKSLHTESKDSVYKEKTQTTEVVENSNQQVKKKNLLRKK